MPQENDFFYVPRKEMLQGTIRSNSIVYDSEHGNSNRERKRSFNIDEMILSLETMKEAGKDSFFFPVHEISIIDILGFKSKTKEEKILELIVEKELEIESLKKQL